MSLVVVNRPRIHWSRHLRKLVGTGLNVQHQVSERKPLYFSYCQITVLQYVVQGYLYIDVTSSDTLRLTYYAKCLDQMAVWPVW